MCECVCVHLRKEKMRRGKSLSLLCTKKREKKMVRTEINKIINTHAIVTVHIYTITVAIVYLYTSLHPLMWVIFCSNCVKVVTFSILHIYALANIIALRFCFSSFGNVALINSVPVCDTLVECGLNVNPTSPTSSNANESLLYLP